jgi:DNA adenine methylase
MKSFIRWAGSKKQLVDKLARYWTSEHRRYIEPFAGSACLFFYLEPSRAILGDLNWELITAMRAIQRRPTEVLRSLRRFPRGAEAYYAVRSWNPASLSHTLLAARFLYLNHYCFNGLYRTNSAGKFNVPYGPPKNGATIDEEVVCRASNLLKSASLLHADFEQIIECAQPGDFVYLDPPYVVSSRRVFSEYGSRTFSSKDLIRLQAALTRLDRKGATFAITYADSSEARKLLRGWRPRRMRTRRNIAGFSGHRRFTYELFATNSTVGDINAN